jgi:tetratricopeptide (TPR) repeat protein
MTQSQPTPDNPKPDGLAELFAQYLRRQVTAHQAGLALPESGDVQPFDPVQPVDPRVAWDEAVAVLRYFPAAAKPVKAPPEWGLLVGAQEPLTALPFCAGNFPQLVRDVQVLLRGDVPAEAPAAGRPIAAEALLAWVEQAAISDSWPLPLLAVGALRLARRFDQAAEVLSARQADIPVDAKAAWANEEAALLWHGGRRTEAAEAWRTQPPSVPVLFNRGLAALCLGQPVEARPLLRQAAEKLPESGAWHHLARLYLALAEMRGG